MQAMVSILYVATVVLACSVFHHGLITIDVCIALGVWRFIA